VAQEGERLLAALMPADHVIALDERGRELTTRELSAWLGSRMQQGEDLAFLIGGPDGLAPEGLARSNYTLALSRLTLPHAPCPGPAHRAALPRPLHPRQSPVSSRLMPTTARVPLLCLASASPRRRELLEQLGVPHVLAVPNIDEAVLAGESAADYVVRIARAKARITHPNGVGLPVLAADTTELIDQLISGKPANAEEGIALLLKLSGRSHEVLTAVALGAAGAVNHRLSRSEVRFRHLSLAEAIAYWNTGEPRDKA